MAIRVSTDGGNFSAATTWKTVSASSTWGTSTVSLTTTPLSSAVFTAPNTTNACIGVLTLHTGFTVNRTSTYYAKLQEYDGSSWVDKATASIAESTLDYTPRGAGTTSFLYFKLPTPYTYTTTTAGYYRWQFYRDASPSGNPTFRRDSASAIVSHITLDDRTGAISASDNLVIVSDPASPQVVTLDGDASIGDGTMALGTSFSTTGFNNPLTIGHSGNLTWSTTQSSTLTCTGCINITFGGEIHIGTTANPFPAAYTGKIVFVGSTLANNAGMHIANYGFNSANDESISFVGATKTLVGWYSSGSGTSASPLITTTNVDWNVDDQICIAGGVYNQYEIKYIKTKNSASSYVLSDSVGGAESAFTNTHTTANLIINGTHNVSIESNNIAVPFWLFFMAEVVDATKMQYITIKYPGGSGSNRNGFYYGNSAIQCMNMDNVSIIDSGYGLYPLYSYYSTKTTSRGTNLAVYRIPVALGGGTNTGSMLTLTQYAGIYNNIYCIGGNYTSLQLSAYGYTISNVYAYNGVANYSSGYQGAGLMLGGVNGVFNNVSAQGCRTNGIQTGGYGSIVKNSNFGTLSTNNYDINVGYQGVFTQTLFQNCNFGSASLFSSPITSDTSSPYKNSTGSYTSFDNCDGTSEKLVYYPNGYITKTGTGLTDTTLSPLGQNCALISPVSLDGLSFEFKVLAVPNQSVSVLGKLKKNATSTSDEAVVELWLPNSTSADVTYTMPSGTDWNTFILGKNYTGTEYSYATVKIICKSATTGAGFYVGDLFNGTNNITNLNLWYQAKQSDIMFEQLGDPNAVWSVLTSTQTTSGTMGKKLVDGTILSDLDPLM